MQVRKTKRSARPTQAPRANTLQANNRKGKNGGIKAGDATAPTGGIGLHLLGKGLRSVTAFEAAMMTGQYLGKTDLFDTIDTEQKQLQCIADLYTIVKAQPRYKKLKDPVLKADTNPTTVILWLMRKLGPLADGKKWTVDTYQEGKITRFCHVVYEDYSSYYVKRPDRSNYSTFTGERMGDNLWDFIPVDFLPLLLKKDRAQHDLIVDTLALVSKANKIPLWDEDGDFSGALDFAGAAFVSDVIAAQAEQYTNGAAAQYLRLLKKRRRVVTVASVMALLSAYDDNSQRKERITHWVRLGLRLATEKETIDKYTYVPGYIKGNPLAPKRHYKIVWSMDDSDPVKVRAISRLKKDEKEYGVFMPREFTIRKPGKKMVRVGYTQFVTCLFTFMSDGNRFFTSTYKEYYYGFRRKALLTGTASFHHALDIMTARGLIQESILEI